MAVPHYTYLVLKMLGPNGIIKVKGSFELSDLYDKEPKGKAASVTTGVIKQLEGHPSEPEAKKLRV
jgi:hypothetical protein